MNYDSVVFKLVIDHAKVEHALKVLKKNRKKEACLVVEGDIAVLTALLCSTYVYVPETQLCKFLPFGKLQVVPTRSSK